MPTNETPQETITGPNRYDELPLGAQWQIDRLINALASVQNLTNTSRILDSVETMVRVEISNAIRAEGKS